MTEGLLTEATAELKQFVASDPSVLAADRVSAIWMLHVSPDITRFDRSEPCRKPAPFGKGAEKDSATEDDSTPSLCKQKAKIKR